MRAEPLAPMLRIMEMRALAEAKRQLDAAEKDADKPTGPIGAMAERLKVEQITADLEGTA